MMGQGPACLSYMIYPIYPLLYLLYYFELGHSKVEYSRGVLRDQMGHPSWRSNHLVGRSSSCPVFRQEQP